MLTNLLFRLGLKIMAMALGLKVAAFIIGAIIVVGIVILI